MPLGQPINQHSQQHIGSSNTSLDSMPRIRLKNGEELDYVDWANDPR